VIARPDLLSVRLQWRRLATQLLTAEQRAVLCLGRANDPIPIPLDDRESIDGAGDVDVAQKETKERVVHADDRRPRGAQYDNAGVRVQREDPEVGEINVRRYQDGTLAACVR
jgi:hypothetical protein